MVEPGEPGPAVYPPAIRSVTRQTAGRDAARVRAFTLALTGLTVLALVPSAWLAVANRHVTAATTVPEPQSWFAWTQLFAALMWTMGGLTLLRRPELGWAPLFTLAGFGHALAALTFGWSLQALVVGRDLPWVGVAVWLLAWVAPFEVVTGAWVAASLPDGTFFTGRGRWLAKVTVGLSVAGIVVAALSRLDGERTVFVGLRNPIAGGLPIPAAVVPLLLVPTAFTGITLVGLQWRRSTGDTRLAMRRLFVIWVAATAVPTALFGFGPGLAIGVGQITSGLQVLAILTVILRHRLFGIDTLFERALRYSLLTGALLLSYVAIVGLADAVFSRPAGPFAAVVVALVALPARDGLARVVGRFVYGDRRQPERLLDAVAQRARLAAAPEDSVAAALREVAEGLRLEQLAVRTAEDTEPVVQIGDASTEHTEHSDRTEHTTRTEHFELVHRGRLVGWLDASPRSGEDELGETDRRALAAVAGHLAVVVDAAITETLLRDSRERLVRVREEERRRLRRDLHDGLGPVLTGSALLTDAASNTVHTDPGAAVDLLNEARTILGDALDEIRRLVEDLRPPALDELGLAAAIAQHVRRFPALHTTVRVSGDVAALPAAVEVAAFRIATEAVTNAARHAGATRVDIELRYGDALEVEVVDDGPSNEPWTPGVGLTSMNERATEIGGSLRAGPSPRGGGRVLARLEVAG